jgi:uncharacterized surface protein with fasciclin (FAS1) repeats
MLSAVLLVGSGSRIDAQQRGNKDIILTLRNAGNFAYFLQAIEGAGLTPQLRGGTQYTVFAPTDDAFGRLPGARRDSLLRDPAALEALVRNHLVEGRLTAEESRAGARGMRFLGGAAIKVDTAGRYTRVNGAQVIKPDMLASNGIIHAVDQIWIPRMSLRVRGTNPTDSAGRASSPPRN